MTKRWGSTVSDWTKAKRQASKDERSRYKPELVKQILEADAAPNEAEFDNVEDLLRYLDE